MLFPRSLLDLGDAQRDLLAIRTRDKGPLFLGLCQSRQDMTKRNGVGPDPKGRAPFFGNRLGQTDHAGLGGGIVGLSRVPMDARGTRDVDDGPGLAVLDAEIRGGRADQTEGRLGVQVHDGVPLLVAHLVDDAVVRVAGVIDDDVDLAAAEFGSPPDQLLGVGRVEHVTGHGEGTAAAGGDGVGHGLGLGGVYVGDDHLGALVGEEPGRLCSDSLSAAGDDGDLAG